MQCGHFHSPNGRFSIGNYYHGDESPIEWRLVSTIWKKRLQPFVSNAILVETNRLISGDLSPPYGEVVSTLKNNRFGSLIFSSINRSKERKTTSICAPTASVVLTTFFFPFDGSVCNQPWLSFRSCESDICADLLFSFEKRKYLRRIHIYQMIYTNRHQDLNAVRSFSLPKRALSHWQFLPWENNRSYHN